MFGDRCELFDKNRKSHKRMRHCTTHLKERKRIAKVKLKIQFHKTDIHMCANSEERRTLEEIIVSNFCTNPSMFGMIELFKGTIVREWMFQDNTRIFCSDRDNLIVKMCVEFGIECWKNCCIAMNETDHQKMVMKNRT